MNVLIIGVSGMIGSAMFRVLDEKNDWKVFGSIRNEQFKRFFPPSSRDRLISGIDVESDELVVKLLDQVRPGVVINCAGLTKHKPEAEDPLVSIPINTLMPHRLAGLCKLIGARLIHVSTDCVFSGEKGGYLETDYPDARDVYGKSKALGEVSYPHTVTLRTSTIGRELQSKYGLLDWFLAQEGQCKGYRRAIFSGLPTVVFAQVIRDVVIPRPNLAGLFHVAAEPIAKFELLQLIARAYGKTINIIPDDNFTINRSLDSTCFRLATGYVAPPWQDLITTMHVLDNARPAYV
jgi:dTDP-4-dehydrorhamnose reductase